MGEVPLACQDASSIKWEEVGGGGSSGVIVLGKHPVPGRPIYLGLSRARAYCACTGCGLGLFGLFFSCIMTLPSFSFSVGDDPIHSKTIKPKTTNQPIY